MNLNQQQILTINVVVYRAWQACVRLLLYVNVTNVTEIWRPKVRQMLSFVISSDQNIVTLWYIVCASAGFGVFVQQTVRFSPTYYICCVSFSFQYSLSNAFCDNVFILCYFQLQRTWYAWTFFMSLTWLCQQWTIFILRVDGEILCHLSVPTEISFLCP